MARPVLEVADIFRDHGPAWRRANAGHVSLDQMKVMSAIESCRTAALNATISADRDADHDQDRYLMTLIAPASIVTAVCSNGWSMAGNDGARQNRTAKVSSQHDCAVIELRAPCGPASVLVSVACIHCRCQHLRARAPATVPTNSP